jgi:hypothetical protein
MRFLMRRLRVSAGELSRDLDVICPPEWGRVVETGDVARRPYGTPCNHEHARIRCPMLRAAPRQQRRLAEIIANLGDRITEARANGWPGEVEGLQVSLDAARAKMASLARAEKARASSQADLGIPVIREVR